MLDNSLPIGTLSASDIYDIIHLRLPEAEVNDVLLKLTPDKVDPTTFRRFIHVMGETGLPFPLNGTEVLDCCGTGGSGLPHYNTSTTAAFILAAGGIPVVKFGNRGMTSSCGSFDFLEALGIPFEMKAEQAVDILGKSGVVFLYAPQWYPALGPFNKLRRTLGVKTIFNFIGPLLNPIKPTYKLLGVSNANMQHMIADYLANETTVKRALIVRAENNLDEIHCEGITTLYRTGPDGVRCEEFSALSQGDSSLATYPLTVQDNLLIFRQLINGEDRTSAYYELATLNAGAGFYIAGKAANILDGANYAMELLRGGKVAETVASCRRAYAQHLS
jgi:anthranilate phosphoribosyltransferase